MTVVCLDFDGVIINSVDECYLTSLRAYCRWKGAEPTEDPGRASFFRRLRKFVRPSGEYWILHHAFDAGIHDLDEEDFAALAAEYSDTIRSFERLFFAERELNRRQDLQTWLRLNPPYTGARECILELAQQWVVHIVTTKDAESVRLLLDHLSIPFDPQRIHGKEVHDDKSDAIRTICQQADLEPGAVYFLDDHPGHLKNVAETGAVCVWASWGYYEHPSGFRGLVAADWKSFLEIISNHHGKSVHN